MNFAFMTPQSAPHLPSFRRQRDRRTPTHGHMEYILIWNPAPNVVFFQSTLSFCVYFSFSSLMLFEALVARAATPSSHQMWESRPSNDVMRCVDSESNSRCADARRWMPRGGTNDKKPREKEVRRKFRNKNNIECERSAWAWAWECVWCACAKCWLY